MLYHERHKKIPRAGCWTRTISIPEAPWPQISRYFSAVKVQPMKSVSQQFSHKNPRALNPFICALKLTEKWGSTDNTKRSAFCKGQCTCLADERRTNVVCQRSDASGRQTPPGLYGTRPLLSQAPLTFTAWWSGEAPACHGAGAACQDSQQRHHPSNL